MRRALAHPLAPVLGAALFGAAYLIAAPATADMAAHTFRTWLFERDGAAVWNAQWYGGHHVLGYSLLFGPVASLAGPAAVGAVSAVVATAAFGAIVRPSAPSRDRAALAGWLFGAGMAANVAIGRMPFALGLALAACAWLAAECARGGARAWSAAAATLALAAVWASPVAGAFLLLATVARVAGGGRGELGGAAWTGAPVLAGGGLLVALFPEGGPDRFVASAFWPMLLVSAAAAALLAPERRAVRAGAGLHLAVLAGAFLVPTTFGQNALRLAVLLGPPALVLAARHRVPRYVLATCGAALLYLQWLPAVRAVGEAAGDPSTQASFFTGARAFLEREARPGERVEVVFSENHWEAARLATSVPLARGPAFLRLAYRSAEWRIWEVRDASPPATRGGRLLAAPPDGFDVVAPERTVVRQRYTRYWHAEGGCVRPAPGGWTGVIPDGAARVRVRAAFALPLTGRARACAAPPVSSRAARRPSPNTP